MATKRKRKRRTNIIKIEIDGQIVWFDFDQWLKQEEWKKKQEEAMWQYWLTYGTPQEQRSARLLIELNKLNK